MRAPGAALAGLLISTTAHAGGVLIPTQQDNIVVVTGDLEAGYGHAFRTVVESARPDVIAFRSPAGRIDEAVSVASEIRKRGLNTFLYSDQPCGSACSLMFLAGRTRYAVAGSQIGFRSGLHAEGRAIEDAATPIGRILLALGIPDDVVSKMNAVGPIRTYWLTENEKQRIGIATLGGDESQPAPGFPRPRPTIEAEHLTQAAKKAESVRSGPKALDNTTLPGELRLEELEEAALSVTFLTVPEPLPLDLAVCSAHSEANFATKSEFHDPVLKIRALPACVEGGDTSFWLRPTWISVGGEGAETATVSTSSGTTGVPKL